MGKKITLVVRDTTKTIVRAQTIDIEYTYQAAEFIRDCRVGDTIEILNTRLTPAEIEVEVAARKAEQEEENNVVQL